MGLRHALASEGAFGRASARTRARDREATFVADDATYFTTLDLSKPLPAKWEFASTQERTPVAAGLALALLFGLQFSRSALSRASAATPSAGSSSASTRSSASRGVHLDGRRVRRRGDGGGVPPARAAHRRRDHDERAPARRRRTHADRRRRAQPDPRRARAGVTLRQRGWPPGIAAGLARRPASAGRRFPSPRPTALRPWFTGSARSSGNRGPLPPGARRRPRGAHHEDARDGCARDDRIAADADRAPRRRLRRQGPAAWPPASRCSEPRSSCCWGWPDTGQVPLTLAPDRESVAPRSAARKLDDRRRTDDPSDPETGPRDGANPTPTPVD